MKYVMLLTPDHIDIKEFENRLNEHNIEFKTLILSPYNDVKYTFKDASDYEIAFNIYVDL